jgi:3',5'-cyclic AMP phosphodiesterase CpdA
MKPVLARSRILVVSDLHVGRNARALDFCPHELSPEARITKTDKYLEIFCSHVKSSEFLKNGKIDYLFVPGDISDQGHPSEFRRADQVLRTLADALEIETTAIFFVPGNHDVSWPVMKVEPSDFWRQFRYEPLNQSDLIFHERITKAVGSLHIDPHIAVWIDANIVVVAINTAAFDGPVPEHGKHNGLVKQESLDRLHEILSEIPYESGCLRACMVHHHPIAYSDMLPNIPDYSALVNAGNLMELLSKHRVDFVVHGHKHVPHITHHQAVTNGHPLTILGAGSFSAELGSAWTGNSTNQFHVIEVEGRKPSSHAVFGHVSTWSFQVSNKWGPGHTRTGLPETEAFGSLTSDAEIDSAIAESLDALIAAGLHCSWEEIEKRQPALEHVRGSSAYRAFKAAAVRKGYVCYGDLDSPQRDWVMFPRQSSVEGSAE